MSTSSGERAYEAIKQQILSGGYPAGARLREEELSAAVGVSRTPIREALRRLSAEGVVEFLPNRGAHVASWTDQELNEIFELRALLESYAARRAATRVGPTEIERLDKLASAMEEALDMDDEESLVRVAELNNEFHQLLMQAAASPQLVTMTQAIVQIPLVHRTFRRYTHADLLRSFAHHRELVDACRAGDGVWAESVMRSHILAARHIFDVGR